MKVTGSTSRSLYGLIIGESRIVESQTDDTTRTLAPVGKRREAPKD